jgi:hypothetical protein
MRAPFLGNTPSSATDSWFMRVRDNFRQLLYVHGTISLFGQWGTDSPPEARSNRQSRAGTDGFPANARRSRRRDCVFRSANADEHPALPADHRHLQDMRMLDARHGRALEEEVLIRSGNSADASSIWPVGNLLG